MKWRYFAIGLLLMGGASTTAPAIAQAQTPVAPALGAAPAPGQGAVFARPAMNSCAGLESVGVAARLARIPDAPTEISSAQVIPADGDGSIIEKGLPEICRVEGQIAPTVGFLLRMPTKTWNGKFMMGGCGGPCGNYLTDRIDAALAKNYAVVVTDMGHRGNGMLYALDNMQGKIDWAYRSTHVTAVAAKVIVEAFYGELPKLSYFWGCSTGGRQALTEAQRFPGDFDGIIGGSPPWITNTGQPAFTSLWRAMANMDVNQKPIFNTPNGKKVLLHNAVLAACDMNDGLKDGLLLNPPACRFDPKSLLCKPGQATDQCMTAAEVTVVEKFYDGPRDSKGRQLFKGWSKGSELQWSFPQSISKEPGAYGALSYVAFSYAPYPDYDPSKFDWDKDPDRFKLVDPIYEHRNPDLTEFKARGGKMIMFNGYNDGCCLADVAIDYYDKVTRLMGGEGPTKEFMRFFPVPGMGHCRYGEGGGEIDWLSALETWVEKGQAPDQVIAHHMVKEPYPSIKRPLGDSAESLTLMARYPLPEDSFDRSRPIYAWPDQARYKGKGDPKLPESWERIPRSKN